MRTVPLALALALASVGALASCGSVSSNAGSFSASDGGGSDTSAGGDDGGFFGDGAPDVSLPDGGQDAGPPPSALFVEASRSLPNTRLCWSVGGTMSARPAFPYTTMPASNYAGIPVGGAARLDDASELLGGGDVTLYAIDADILALIEQPLPTRPRCDQLICGSGGGGTLCLKLNSEYQIAGVVPAGTLHDHAANVVALSGCSATLLDQGASAESCGPTWDGAKGNLHVDVIPLVQAGSSLTGRLAVQAAQLSPGLAGNAVTAIVSFGAQDAGQAGVVATLSGEGTLGPGTPAPLTIPAGLASYGDLGFALDVTGLDAGTQHLWMSLIQSQQLVDPAADPTQYFGQTRTYVVAVVGDALHAPPFTAGGYDGKGLHLLVLPSP